MAVLPWRPVRRCPAQRDGIFEMASTRRARRVERLLAARNYSANTNSIDADDVCLSSGALLMTLADWRAPASTATYCLPLTEKEIGGALMPVPTLKLQTSAKVLASCAENVPSTWPMKTRLPAGAHAPEKFGQVSCRASLGSPATGSTALRLPV